MMPCIRDPVVLGLSPGFGGCKAICIEPDPRVSLIFKQKKKDISTVGVLAAVPFLYPFFVDTVSIICVDNI